MTRGVLAAVVAAGVLVSGCGGGDDDAAVPTPAAELDDEVVAASAQVDLFQGLRAIDAGLMANPDRAVRNADNACDAITRGTSRPDVEEVRLRFDGGTVSVNKAMAEKILAVLQEKYCEYAPTGS